MLNGMLASLLPSAISVVQVGFLLPKAPLVVCCQKEVWGGY